MFNLYAATRMVNKNGQQKMNMCILKLVYMNICHILDKKKIQLVVESPFGDHNIWCLVLSVSNDRTTEINFKLASAFSK